MRAEGHEVYDFRNPEPGNNGFHWSEIDPDWKQWTPEQFSEALRHNIAVEGFGRDWGGMQSADAGVLVMPCNRSAHLEAGYFVGAGKPLFILLSDGEPELMYKMASHLTVDVDNLVRAIRLAEIRGYLETENDPRLLQAIKHIVDNQGCCWEFATTGPECCPAFTEKDGIVTWADNPPECSNAKKVQCALWYFNLRRHLKTCRVCGCTDDYACKTPDVGGCRWVEMDLCSECVGSEEDNL